MTKQNSIPGPPQFGAIAREREVLNLREIIEGYIIYWKWIIVSAVVFVIAGMLYLRTQQPVYEFKASVLVMDPRSQMNEMSILNELKQMGFSSSRNATNNEERVLRSTHLMRRVTDELDLYITYMRKQKLYMEDLYTDSPYRVIPDSSTLNSLVHTLYLEIEKNGNNFEVEGRYSDEDFEYEFEKLPARINTPMGPVLIEINEAVLHKQPEKRKNGKKAHSPLEERVYVSIIHPDRTAQSLASTGIKTEIDKLADEIWISYRSNHMRKGKDVLNALIRLYNRDAVEQITQSAIFSGIFIDDRLSLLEKELTEEEQRIEKYKQTNELTNIDTDAGFFLESNTRFYNQQIETEIQLQLVDYILQYLKNPANKLRMIPDPGLSDVNMAGVINEYNFLLMQRDRVVQGGTKDNPMLQNMTRQAETMFNSILEGIGNLKRSLQIRNKELLGQNSLLRTRLRSIPRQEREFVEIKRQQQVKESLYVFLLQKKEEASLSKAIATNKARLLNSPDLARQVAPRSVVITAVFFLMGLFFPIGVIFIRNLLATTISSRSDVEKLTQLPILSELSHNKSPEPLFDHTSSDEPNGELFRLLRAKLQFVLGNDEKVVLVTSTQPGEGKSFVSVNLSVSLSMMDKKVLLVGLDLRKPTLTKILGIATKDGITAYLSGQQNDPFKLICKVDDVPHLDVLPAGVIPPNPNELIMMDKFDELFTLLKPHYDYIILDSSPVGAVSDTYLIDRVADLCLYVCRSEYSDKRNIEFINRLDKEGTLKRIYIVINDVKFESNKYSYYRKYGYGYGYGYK
jgi:capsular exopolysaccharide synthesis family protein